MSRAWAAMGSALFFVVAPGVVAGFVPWLLTRWEVRDVPLVYLPLQVVGGTLILAAAAALVHSFARFVLEGSGTPAPVAPTARLVVGGLYRYCRNPMYVAVLAIIGGQALLLAQPVLVLYGALIWAAVAAFVRGYEEPVLRGRYGDQYEAYRRAVPGWRPRLQPWTADGPQSGDPATH